MRASSDEREPENRDFQLVRSGKGGDRVWTHGWNRSARQCISVMSMEGLYDSITDALPADGESVCAPGESYL